MTNEEYIFGGLPKIAVVAGIVVLILLVVKVLSRLFARMGWSVPLLSLPNVDSPAIWSRGIAEKQILMLDTGKVSGYQFVLYSAFSVDSGTYMVLELVLHKSSPLHALCINTEASTVTKRWKTEVMEKDMEPIVLEGDFPSYFNVYSSKKRQVEIRELFDPATMAYFVDFCRNFDFEVLDNSLFVAIYKGSEPGDTTPAVVDAIKLAKVLEMQIAGWVDLNPSYTPVEGYDPMKHFKGDKSKLKPGSYILADKV